MIHAVSIGMGYDEDDELDTWPVKRCMRPAGTWTAFYSGRPEAQPFDAMFLGVTRV